LKDGIETDEKNPDQELSAVIFRKNLPLDGRQQN
jgi:hypothetical protein